ncbi:DUF3078 domain-containing protein [uncultured Nonlabens sp.]|uniref:DUF3078 domain-containing protein n=1 Tax=uncultured Nonlabens sp. TaxID=859306 RepID=UPI00262C7318|nr:DUF3078 domain-containing protein [uncultured Nonlabens sp.]
MKKILLSVVLLFSVSTVIAQTEAELKALKKVKQDSIAQIQSRVNAIQGKIDALPGWKKGAFGTLGVNLSSFDNWYSQGSANVSAGNIGLTANAFANLKQPKYFWRNSLNINLGWVKFDDKDDPTDDDSFQEATDVFNISSLYGYKLTEKLAVSTLAEYRTTILNNFNDPGYLDVGVGATWTPIDNLVVVVHPLNYNFVFAKNDAVFESSLGAKVVADYTRSIGKVSFKSNLSAFYSYENSDLSNYTWINSFGYTLWKNIGVGFEFGLRGNKQEALNFANNNLAVGATELDFDTVDNKLQSYYLVGLNYKF